MSCSFACTSTVIFFGFKFRSWAGMRLRRSAGNSRLRDKASSITGGNAGGHLMYNGVLKRKTFWTSAGLQEASCKLLIAHITYIPTGTGARWGSPRLLSCSCAWLWVRRQILSRNNIITKKMYNLIVAAGR